MILPESFTIGQLKNLESVRPDLAAFGKRLTITSYSSFVDILNEDLDECISYIEEDPKVRQSDSEDRLTSEIIGLLRARGYDASHDEMIGGHSDIVVRHFHRYLWVAEAKIHSDYDYLRGGYNQLTTRYLRGTPNADQGAFLIYNRTRNTANTIKEWLNRLSATPPTGFKHTSCPVRQELGFYSTETHDGAGREVTIRHIGINQYWQPIKD